MTSVVERWTPELAARALERYNHDNRKLLDLHVATLARAMENGTFVMNGKPIIFAKSGRLLDGQHRLSAIVKSGVTVTMLTVRGVPDSVFGTIDTDQRTRTLATVLSLGGTANAQKAATIARAVLQWSDEHGLLTSTSGYDTATAAEVMQVATTPEVAAATAFVVGNKATCRLFTASSGGFLHWLLSRINREAAEHFLLSTASGVNLGDGDPRLILSRFLRNYEGSSRYDRRAKIGAAIKAWNAWQVGDNSRRTYVTRHNETFPMPVGLRSGMAAEAFA